MVKPKAHLTAKLESTKGGVSITAFIEGLIFEFNNKPASDKKKFFTQIIGQK